MQTQIQNVEFNEQEEERKANITFIEKTISEHVQDMSCNKITLAKQEQEIENYKELFNDIRA